MSEGTVEITRIIRSAIESPSEAEVKGTVLDPRGGIIKLPIPLINWRGREILRIEEGAIFDPHDLVVDIPDQYMKTCTAEWAKVNSLPSYRKYGTVYLNRIQVAANRLLEAIENYKQDNHPDITQARRFLQAAYSYYEDTIIHTLGGKFGLLARHVMGMRLNYSMMTPVAGSHIVTHTQVLIPDTVADQIKAAENDIIMVHREPLLWGRGIVFLRAKIVPASEANSVRIPWLVFKGMNADCDGDLMFLCNISKHIEKLPPEQKQEILSEVEAASAEDVTRHEYSASLCLLADNPQPETDVLGDIQNRVNPEIGLSFGLEDVFAMGDENYFLEILNAHLGIEPERILAYAKPLAEKEWTEEIHKTTKALCYTKKGLGLVGAIGSYCLALSTYYKRCLPAAIAIKEGLSQTVLDAKHGEDLDHIQECLSALMKADAYAEATPEQRLEALVRNGFDRDQMRELFDVLGDSGIVSKVYRDFPAFLLGSTDSNTRSLLMRFIDGDNDRSGPGQDAGAWWDNCIRKTDVKP